MSWTDENADPLGDMTRMMRRGVNPTLPPFVVARWMVEQLGGEEFVVEHIRTYYSQWFNGVLIVP